MKRNDSPSGRLDARTTVTLICLALLGLPHLLVAQPTRLPSSFKRIGTEAGLPIIRNYTPKEYGAGPQNLGMKQDSRGVLYIANYNDSSILEFDGTTWRKIKIPGGFGPNHLAIDENDRVYAAANGEFGVLTPEATGILRLHSLLKDVKPEDRQFSKAESFLATEHGIYLQTPERLFRWYADTMKVWKPRTVFNQAFLVRDKFYVHEDGLGLMEMMGDSLQMVAGGEKFLNMPVGAMFPFHDGRNESILIVITGKGLFIYSGASLQPFPGEASEFIRQYGIRCSAVLDDSTFAIGTGETGVIIFDDHGRILQVLNEEAGLASNIVYDILPDRDGGIWMASLQGISRLSSIRPAITTFDERLGLKGIVGNPPVRHNGILYIQTTIGVFYLDQQQSKFVPVAGLEGELWRLFEHGGSLYAVKTSLRKITGSGSTLVMHLQDRAHFVWPSRLDANRVYLVFPHGGFCSLVQGSNGWREETPIPGILGNTLGLAEKTNGDLWLGTGNGGVFHLRFSSQPQNPEVHYFDTKEGLPVGEIDVFRTSWGVKFTSDNGIYHFDERTQRFAPDTTFGTSLGDGSRGVQFLAEDKNGNIWFAVKEGSHYYLNVSRRQAHGGFILERKPFLDVPSIGIWMVFPEANGIVWFGGEEGLFRCDDNVRRHKEVEFPALVRRVIVNEDSVIYSGASVAAKRVELPYAQNSLRFECAATSFALPSANRFQFFLEGFDKAWSGWTHETTKEYTNIPEGTYTFRVRAQNVYEQRSNEGHYSFEIFPPWYRTWWAYSLYGLVFFGLLYAVRQYEISRQQFKHEAELQKVETAQLQEMDALKSRFFANISHEFRTPLTLILGQTENLLSKERDSEEKNQLQMSLRNAKQLLILINQLLDLSKFEAGQMTLRASQQNIVPLLKHLIFSFDSWAAQKKIALQFDTSHDEILLWYEQDKIEKVMYNLLSNALKFTPEGGKVSVQCSMSNEQLSMGREDSNVSEQLSIDHCLLITVRDSGIGIPHDRLPHIFDRFFQVDSSQTREYEGTGIGLALAQELVQIHGGGISVQSTEGFGTTFVISLPLGKDHLKPEQIAALKSKKQEANGKEQPLKEELQRPSDQSERSEDPALAGQPATSSDFILIVEDNADMRAFISENLHDEYRIVEAANGEEGFIKAQEYIPDLIITDVMMPRVDGYEMTRRVRQDQITSHIPIIMLTARAADEDKFEGLERGVDAYLTKPFNKTELRIRVRKLIELRRQLRQRTGAKAVLTPSEIEASSMDQEFLQRVQESIEKNMENENFSVDDLAGQIGMGKRQLQRKLKALTDSSPQQCIRTMRLQRARQLLEQGAGTISEIAFRVGYSEGSALARAFREEFGFAPSEVKSPKEK